MKALSIFQLFVSVLMLIICIGGYIGTTIQNGFNILATVVLAGFTLLACAIFIISIDELKEGGDE